MTQRRRMTSGFTLIELLVVVVVIASLVAIVTVRFDFNTGDDRLREEIRRFDVLLHMAWEQALIEGRSIGIEVSEDGYRFYVYEPLEQQWRNLENDSLLRPRTLPDGTTFTLRMEDQEIELPTQEDSDDDIVPQILLLSSGEATPFSIYVESDATETDYELLVEANGDSRIIEHERGF